jgi:ABC-2 type transport system permease protein
MNAARFSPARVGAVVRKDVEELLRQPALFVPALLMVLGLVAPAFAITIVVPRLTGRGLETSEFAAAADAAVRATSDLSGLSGSAGVQAYLLQQFLVFGLLVPVLGSLSMAAHAIIGEKQSRALEPLLSTPITTMELLAAKTLMPLMVSASLLLLTFGLYLAGMLLFGEPGVWLTLFGPRTLILYLLTAPLATFAALLLAAIVSSRVNDPRSAQQLGALLVLPITAVFVAQLAGRFLLGVVALLWAAAGLALLDAVLLWVGVRVFARETILMRWK